MARGRPPQAGEAIRPARQLTLATEEREARGLLALMLLNHARLPARLDPEGRIITLDRQDRGLWDTREIAEGVRLLQSALTMQTEDRRPGRYQDRGRHRRAARRRGKRRGDPLAADPRLDDDLVALTDDPVRDHLVRQAARARAGVDHVGVRAEIATSRSQSTTVSA